MESKKDLVKFWTKPFRDPVMLFYMFSLLALYVVFPDKCGAVLPWETPLGMLESSLTGPVVSAAAAITVVACGIMMAMGEGGQFGRLAIRLVMGLSLAILGNKFIKAMFGTTSN